MTRTSLSALSLALHPASVAVVGVSEDPMKYGSRVARSIVEAGFPRELYFVNPRPGAYMGNQFVPSLASIGKAVDLVLVAVPSVHCPDVIRQAAQLGCGCAVVVANGFAEIGAVALQRDLVQAAAGSDLRIIGPNCMGIQSNPAHLAAMGDATVPVGRIAVVAQSGIVGIFIYESAKTRAMGLSYFISLGNQADIACEDVLDYLADDVNSDVVVIYMEGFRNLPRFLEAAATLATRKSVVILRGGRTAAGARAALSHTASLADDDSLVTAAFRATGLVEVDSPNELLLAAIALSDPTPLRGRSVAIVSDSGGYATLGGDTAAQAGLTVATHSGPLQARLRTILLPQATVTNPVDMIGGPEIRPDIFQRTVEACLEEPSVNGVVVVGAFGGYQDFGGPTLAKFELEAAIEMQASSTRVGKPLVIQSVYSQRPHEGLAWLRRHGVPVVEHLEEAMRLMEIKARYTDLPRTTRQRWPLYEAPRGQTTGLLEDESRSWLAKRIPGMVPPWEVTDSEISAIAAAKSLGGPVVLKVLSARAMHKSDVGGVFLDLRVEHEIRSAWRHIAQISDGFEERPRALVTRYEPPGFEALVGVFKHASLGPAVVVGTGGVFTEPIGDRVLLFPPFSEDEVADSLQHLLLGRVIRSSRSPAHAFEGLAKLAVAVGDVAMAEPSLVELDLNPVLLSLTGARILDVRVITA